jgi:hypothetical protein
MTVSFLYPLTLLAFVPTLAAADALPTHPREGNLRVLYVESDYQDPLVRSWWRRRVR